MTDNPRLRQLLDELHDSHATPEEVCRSCPELLPEVRARWRAVCRVRAEVDALFPAPAGRGAGAPAQLPAYGGSGLGSNHSRQHLAQGLFAAVHIIFDCGFGRRDEQ